MLPPLGLAYLAAYLREKGVEVEVLDCSALGLSWRGLEHELRTRKPDVVGVGAITCYIHLTAKVAEVAKEVDSSITVVAGGPHPSLMPEQTLRSYSRIDYVVVGEGEQTLYQLVKCLEEGGDPKKVEGIAYRDKEDVRLTAPRKLIHDLDSLPQPAWDLLPMDRYRFVVWGRKLGMLVSSRGCPFTCSFCSERILWGSRWRAHSPKRMADDVEVLAKRYGRRIIWFGDDTFNLDRRRVEAFCDELSERSLDVEWSFEGRVDLLLRDKDLLPKMKRAGLAWVLLGVETPFEEELSFYGKGISAQQVFEAFKLLREHDVVSQAMIIIGAPSDTRESIRKKLEFVKKLDPDFAIFTPLTPLPGTPLYELAKREEWLVVEDFSKYDFAHAVMRTKELSPEEVQRLMNLCYQKFFARTSKVLRGVFSRNRHRRAIVRYFLKKSLLP